MVVTWRPDGINITAATDTYVHLYCIYSFGKARITRHPQITRGAYTHDKVTFSLPQPRALEQLEPGYTITHTFFIPISTSIDITFYFVAYLPPFNNRGRGTSAPFKYAFRRVDMYVISLAKLGDPPGQVLDGAVCLEEGAGVTITRIVANNSLKIAAAGGYPGFLQNMQIASSAHPTFDIASFYFDQLTLGVAYVGDNLRVFTPQSELYDFYPPHTMQIAVKRDADATFTLSAALGLAYPLTDILNNQSERHIAFILKSNKIYASCGDATGQTKTLIDATGPYIKRWLRWKRTAAAIEYYEDGVLKATHTTNIPAYQDNLRWVYQVLGTGNAPRNLYCSYPRYSEV